MKKLRLLSILYRGQRRSIFVMMPVDQPVKMTSDILDKLGYYPGDCIMVG